MSMRGFLTNTVLPGALLIVLYAALFVGVLVQGAIVEF